MIIAAEVDQRIAGIRTPGIEIDPAARQVAINALGDIDRDYGEGSENPRTHHNAPHGLDNMGGGFALIDPVFDLIPSAYQEDIYDLHVVDGAVHDRYQGLKVFGANEILSAAYGINLISEHPGSRINNERFIYRSAGGVIATTAFTKPDGTLVQPKLLEGENDPHKFFMAAADVYAPIARGGVYEMLRISRNLTLEYCKNPGPVDGYNFVAGEVLFLRNGLDPERIREVLGHFFPDTADDVYSVYEDLFNDNIVEASAFARAVDKMTDKAQDIGEAVLAGEFEAVGEIVDLPVHKIG